LKLNYVQYGPDTGSVQKGLVAYVVCEKTVVYSGLLPQVSTINNAEKVVQAICQQMKINWCDYTFIDLQTSRGYSRLKKFERDVSRLVLGLRDSELAVEEWRPIDESMLPRGSAELFDALPWYEPTADTDLDDIINSPTH
jgi:hypothetical protein